MGKKSNTLGSDGSTGSTNPEIKPEKETPSKSEREKLWAEYIETYKASNPVKYATKDKNGEFDEIPTSFRGIVRIKNGKRFVF